MTKPAFDKIAAGLAEARALVAHWNHASCGFECPYCGGGAVPDWEKKAPLRCTCCKRELSTESFFSR